MNEFVSAEGYTLHARRNFQGNANDYRIWWQHPEVPLGIEGVVGGSFTERPPTETGGSWEVWWADRVASQLANARDMHGFVFENRNRARKALRAIRRKLREVCDGKEV